MEAYYTVWYCCQGSTHFGMKQWQKLKDAMAAIKAKKRKKAILACVQRL